VIANRQFHLLRITMCLCYCLAGLIACITFIYPSAESGGLAYGSVSTKVGLAVYGGSIAVSIIVGSRKKSSLLISAGLLVVVMGAFSMCVGYRTVGWTGLTKAHITIVVVEEETYQPVACVAVTLYRRQSDGEIVGKSEGVTDSSGSVTFVHEFRAAGEYSIFGEQANLYLWPEQIAVSGPGFDSAIVELSDRARKYWGLNDRRKLEVAVPIRKQGNK
jgi:hypothetical protein